MCRDDNLQLNVNKRLQLCMCIYTYTDTSTRASARRDMLILYDTHIYSLMKRIDDD
jgi:hypothetical protein